MLNQNPGGVVSYRLIILIELSASTNTFRSVGGMNVLSGILEPATRLACVSDENMAYLSKGYSGW